MPALCPAHAWNWHPGSVRSLDGYSTERAYAHVRIALLGGRTPGERKELADAVLAALTAVLAAPPGHELQLSVETVDLDRASYAKAVVHG